MTGLDPWGAALLVAKSPAGFRATCEMRWETTSLLWRFSLLFMHYCCHCCDCHALLLSSLLPWLLSSCIIVVVTKLSRAKQNTARDLAAAIWNKHGSIPHENMHCFGAFPRFCFCCCKVWFKTYMRSNLLQMARLLGWWWQSKAPAARHHGSGCRSLRTLSAI